MTGLWLGVQLAGSRARGLEFCGLPLGPLGHV